MECEVIEKFGFGYSLGEGKEEPDKLDRNGFKSVALSNWTCPDKSESKSA